MTTEQSCEEYLTDMRSMSPTALLAYWMLQRERIRLKRESGNPKPWTIDPILQSYRFCNVRRMDDKVSQWLLNKWYLPNKNDGNMLVAITVARHINLPRTLEVIGFPVSSNPIYAWFEAVKRKVRNIQRSGRTAYNSAYMVRGIETADKIEMIIDKVTKPLYENPPRFEVPMLMQQAVTALLPYWGISSFMAGQIVADLRWVWNHVHGYSMFWSDRMSYAPMGPGSKRGMNRLFERPINYNLKQEQFEDELQQVMASLRQYKSLKFVTDRLEAMDYQNCLCEYDKYCRTLHGEGKPKQRYQGA